MRKQNDLTLNGDLVRQMATLLEETGLTEIDYTSGDQRIRVSRSAVMVQSGPALAAPVSAAPAGEPAAADLRDHPGAVKSPMVGTVYLSPQPGAAAFVKVGDTIGEGQTLLIVEAMKVMNQIRAPRAGRLVQLLVADGSPVEFGETLMVLE